MKPKGNDTIGDLIAACPESFNPWSLEPLKTIAFLDPLLKYNETEDEEHAFDPPLSFPDFYIPLIRFDADIQRDFVTGQIASDHSAISYSCPRNLFHSEEEKTRRNDEKEDEGVEKQPDESSVKSVLASICDRFLPNFPADQRLEKSWFAKEMKLDADDVLDDFLSVGNQATVTAFTSKSPRKPAEFEEQDEKNGNDDNFSLKKMDQATLTLLEKRMRKPNDEMVSYSVLEPCNEKLPTLSEMIPDPAFTWPFELDSFQKQAIQCLERGQSVLVAAHTSAGKTVVAEYACAMCKRRGSRAIYTSPIKALSNQKFRDFRKTFGEDVGLLTGDIKVATKSSILVMTTEILHNMLCNAAETIRDLEIVIMDEVHYLNDKERGHVWEQLMIMLPRHVILVLLSATLPNALEFADWLGRIRGRSIIHVSSTNKRPVPLEHFLYTGQDSQTRENVYLIVDKDGRFCLEGYKKAKQSLLKPTKMSKAANALAKAAEFGGQPLGNFVNHPDPSAVENKQTKEKPRSQFTGGKNNTPGRQAYFIQKDMGRGTERKSETTVWVGLIRMLKERELMPVIVFCFSRARINTLANSINSVDLLNKNEKNEVFVFLRSAIGNRLKGPDKLLSQVLLIRKLAMRGIAVHHAGILPLLKEVVEMLFQRGLVRILFATETFAMGVNMPARCVVFTSIQKHDGNRKRDLTAGEYTQMAGRAGRRGLDTTGTVIIMANQLDQMPPELQLTQMLLGQATKLKSQFKITYSMILYLHRGNLQTPQELIRQSFLHAVDLRFEVAWRRQLKRLREAVFAATVPEATAPVASFSTTKEGFRESSVATTSIDTLPVSYAKIKCPFNAASLDCLAASTADCVNTIAAYYLKCSRWRDLTYNGVRLMAEEPLTQISRVFSPGRLLLLHLSEASVSFATKNAAGSEGQLNPLIGSKCVPDWITLGVVIQVSKVPVDPTVAINSTLGRCHLRLKVVTWRLPPSPTDSEVIAKAISSASPDGSGENEEDLLIDGEVPHLAFPPFPPNLMPIYCPTSLEDSKTRLAIVSDVPMTSVLSVCCATACPTTKQANSHTIDAWGEQLAQEVAWFRHVQLAADSGLMLMKKKRGGDSPVRAKTTCLQPIDLVNQLIYSCATEMSKLISISSTVPERLPVWHHLGINNVAVDELMELTEDFSQPIEGGEEIQRIVPPSCCNLIGHLALAHRITRRRWAINRMSTRLSRNDDGFLLGDYEARIRILEELGFLDKTTRSGCLTLKGRAACELQQMEVLLAEVLFEGSITHTLPPADIAALLSCFVCESGQRSGLNHQQQKFGHSTSAPVLNPFEARVGIIKPKNEKESEECDYLPTVPDHLQSAVKAMLNKADQLLRLQTEYRVADPESDARLNPVLVGATHAWASGQPFSSIVNLPGTESLAEGHLLRGLQRLDELLRHVCSACMRLGDRTLAKRIEEAHRAVHRDLVCAPSLYLADEGVGSTEFNHENKEEGEVEMEEEEEK